MLYSLFMYYDYYNNHNTGMVTIVVMILMGQFCFLRTGALQEIDVMVVVVVVILLLCIYDCPHRCCWSARPYCHRLYVLMCLSLNVRDSSREVCGSVNGYKYGCCPYYWY